MMCTNPDIHITDAKFERVSDCQPERRHNICDVTNANVRGQTRSSKSWIHSIREGSVYDNWINFRCSNDPHQFDRR
jgi:hypothetical protein